jgi:hypothetical protein
MCIRHCMNPKTVQVAEIFRIFFGRNTQLVPQRIDMKT